MNLKWSSKQAFALVQNESAINKPSEMKGRRNLFASLRLKAARKNIDPAVVWVESVDEEEAKILLFELHKERKRFVCGIRRDEMRNVKLIFALNLP
jgi:hypothetical protein